MPRGQRVSVLLDAGPILHQKAGLHRYATQLACHLAASETERLEVRLFYNDHSGHKVPEQLRFVPYSSLPMGQYRWRLSVLALQLARQKRFENLLPPSDVYHATEHLLPCLNRRTVMTVHDLIFKVLPDTHTWKNRAFLSTAMPIFLKRADALISVSQQTKRDLESIYGVPSERVTVIPEGISSHFRPASLDSPISREIRQRHGEYFLMVGTLEPRKNHSAVLRAMARLHAQGCETRLVIAGGQGWKFSPVERQVSALGLDDRVDFVGYVPEESLPALYSNALALLQPSLYEGFGFPVLEAMACAAPTLVSDRSSLPELAGDSALTVNPDDTEALSDALLRLATLPQLREELRSKGMQHVRSYTWTETSRQTAELYQSLI